MYYARNPHSSFRGLLQKQSICQNIHFDHSTELKEGQSKVTPKGTSRIPRGAVLCAKLQDQVVSEIISEKEKCSDIRETTCDIIVSQNYVSQFYYSTLVYFEVRAY